MVLHNIAHLYSMRWATLTTEYKITSLYYYTVCLFFFSPQRSLLLLVSYIVLHVVLCLLYFVFFIFKITDLHYTTVYLAIQLYKLQKCHNGVALSYRVVPFQATTEVPCCATIGAACIESDRRTSTSNDVAQVAGQAGRQETPAVHVGAWSIVVRLNTGPDRTGLAQPPVSAVTAIGAETATSAPSIELSSSLAARATGFASLWTLLSAKMPTKQRRALSGTAQL